MTPSRDNPSNNKTFETNKSDENFQKALEAWGMVEKVMASGNQVPAAMANQALEHAKECLESKDKDSSQQERALQFADHCIHPIVESLHAQGILQETKDYYCVLECLEHSARIIANELQLQENGHRSPLAALALLFRRDGKLYQDAVGRHRRLQVIEAFQVNDGFVHLASYLHSRYKKGSTLPLSTLSSFGDSLVDLIGESSDDDDDDESVSTTSCSDSDDSSTESSTFVFSANAEERKTEAVQVAKSMLGYLQVFSVEYLKRESLESFGRVLDTCGCALDRSCQDDVRKFQDWTCKLVHWLITLPFDELKDFGYKQTARLVERAKKHRPPARTITVSGASPSFLNGTYSYTNTNDFFRYNKLLTRTKGAAGAERMASIVKMFEGNKNGCICWLLTTSKKLDGSDSSIHFMNVSLSTNDLLCPEAGWEDEGTCTFPHISTTSDGFVFRDGEEHDTLEHQLASWAVECKVVELCFGESSYCDFATRATHIVPLLKLLLSMHKWMECPNIENPSIDKTKFLLDPLRISEIWSYEETSLNVGGALVSIFYYVPEKMALSLLATMGQCMVLSKFAFAKVESFVEGLSHWLGLEIKEQEPWERLPVLSLSVQRELKKLMWRLRSHPDASITHYRDGTEKDSYESWVSLERELCASRQEAQAATATDESSVPQKPNVVALDPAARLVQVSMPVKSAPGDYYVAMRVYAVADGNDAGESLVASIDRDQIEQCLVDNNDMVNTQVTLPLGDMCTISWQGLVLRDGTVQTPRSLPTIVDLTSHDTQQQKQRQMKITAMNELAKKHAGDILGVIGKLRGSTFSKLGVDKKAELLQTSMSRGRSTLKRLESLVEAPNSVAASVSGIATLSKALAQAQGPMNELEAAIGFGDKKNRSKRFKAYVSSLLTTQDAVAWMESVDSDGLRNLGGDANRLFQLLVDDKGSKANDPAILKAAFTRENLFSAKQIKKIELLVEKDVSVGLL